MKLPRGRSESRNSGDFWERGVERLVGREKETAGKGEGDCSNSQAL